MENIEVSVSKKLDQNNPTDKAIASLFNEYSQKLSSIKTNEEFELLEKFLENGLNSIPNSADQLKCLSIL